MFSSNVALVVAGDTINEQKAQIIEESSGDRGKRTGRGFTKNINDTPSVWCCRR
jgi:hypothetical protein